MTPEMNVCLNCGGVLLEDGSCPGCGLSKQELPSCSGSARARAPVDPSDEKLPNGIVISRDDAVSIVNSTSQTLYEGISLLGTALSEIKGNFISLRSTFDVNQEEISNKSDIPGKIDLMRDKLNQIGSNVKKMESDVEKILDQTTEPTSEQKIIADARSGIIGWIVAAIMTLIAVLLGWKAFI